MSTATISCSTPDAIIRYEIGGVDPTESSPLYSSPVEFSGEIRAKAWKEGLEASDIAVAVEEDDVPYYYKEYDVTYTKNSSGATQESTINFQTPISSEDIEKIFSGNFTVTLSLYVQQSGYTVAYKYHSIQMAALGSTFVIYFSGSITTIEKQSDTEFNLHYLNIGYDSDSGVWTITAPLNAGDFDAWFTGQPEGMTHKFIISGFIPTT